MRKIVAALAIGLGVYGYLQNIPHAAPTLAEERGQHDQTIRNAYQNKLSDVQVSGSGKVSQLLSDDTKGSRHQRFILRLPSGQTVLVAHNIDLAPKIRTLKKGDVVHYAGEYEWNAKGGVIHWTHHDPGGQHKGGWLKHDGRKYE